MIIAEYYLSAPSNLVAAEADTGLALDELECIVGRFDGRSRWDGQLKGKILVRVIKGGVMVEIRHHFNKKVLWRRFDEH